MENHDAIKVLNDLIHTSEDGHKGFAEAAETAKDPQLKTIFREYADECARAIVELQAGVRSLGGSPADSGSITGAAHRGWVKVKSAVEDANIAVLEEVERGQDSAKAAYTKALNAHLPPALLGLVQKQHAGAVRNHDRIRDLRNAYKAQHAASMQ
jgi:uncharacterized protein (TIGR02284 family)